MFGRYIYIYIFFFFWGGGGGGVKPSLQGGGGGTLIFSYIRRLGAGPFLAFKILNFNIFEDFQKNGYVWGMEILWIFLGVITKLDYI